MTNLANDGKIDSDAAGKLKSLITEVERLEEQKKTNK